MGKVSTTWTKGNSPRKQKGQIHTATKLMRTVRDVVLSAFNELQGDPKANIVSWGKSNPTAFYNIAARLIPTQVKASIEGIDVLKVEIIALPKVKPEINEHENQ